MRSWILIVALAVCAGCGAASTSHLHLPPSGTVTPPPHASTSDATAAATGAGDLENATSAASAASAAPAAPARRIIYEAQLELVVDSLDEFERRLPERVREHGGYLADAKTNRSPGQRPSGTWVVRIPVDRFEDFLAATGDGAFPQRLNQTSKEVTQEYVDLESRITNARRLEERLVKLLENSKSELHDIITLERELARSRGELEQLEGRRRLLENRTAMSTVTIEVREREPYVPAKPPVAEPNFSERLATAWQTSWANLRELGEGLVIGLARCAPWLVIGAVFLLPVAAVVWRLQLSCRG